MRVAHEIQWIESTARLLTPEAPLLKELEDGFPLFLLVHVAFPVRIAFYLITASPMMTPRCWTPFVGRYLSHSVVYGFFCRHIAHRMSPHNSTLDRIKLFLANLALS